ncbi:MAG: carboxymuconolactone decarboxylase family protein [Planctomycetota bacterium]|nr:carboxymuconolactone decarboxylase family protein [Planctomycetota bacterium]
MARPAPRKIPRRYLEARERYPAVLEAYERFGAALEKAGPLSRREQRLVKLGLAFGAKMEGASHSAVRKGLDAGLTPHDLEHAALLAMNSLGFSSGMTCLCWVRDITESSGKPSRKRERKPS